MFKYHKDGSLPEDDSIFVFGSNLSGIHGAGAALVAKNRYGAMLGEGEFLMGDSYAIPTKDETIQTRELQDIQKSVEHFVCVTWNLPEKKFFVTRIGCGLAGYKDKQIAPMFKGCNPRNCSFPEEWEPYLE